MHKENPILISEPSNFYTSLEVALEKLRERRRNFSLRRRVEVFLKNVPNLHWGTPMAMLGRFIATPNHELYRFMALTQGLDVKPVIMETIWDKFCTLNPDKLNLVHMPFYKGNDKHGKILFEYHNISNCTKYQGKKLCNISTYSGESLVSFHHRLLSLYLNSINKTLFIDNTFYLCFHGRPHLFYSYFLPQFICHGILFENFITNTEEKIFFVNVVLPAFTATRKFFGVKPLIVKLLPYDNAADIFWRCYPYEMKKYVLKGSCNQNIVSNNLQAR